MPTSCNWCTCTTVIDTETSIGARVFRAEVSARRKGDDRCHRRDAEQDEKIECVSLDKFADFLCGNRYFAHGITSVRLDY